MTMVNCRECSAEVSDRAKTCPRCGVKSPKGRGGVAKTWAIVLGGFVALAAIGQAVEHPSASNTAATSAPATTISTSTDQAAAEARRTSMLISCYNAVHDNLQDPEGAELPSLMLGQDQFHFGLGKGGRTVILAFDFRARNGFNALRSARATCRFKLNDKLNPVSFSYSVRSA